MAYRVFFRVGFFADWQLLESYDYYCNAIFKRNLLQAVFGKDNVKIEKDVY